MSYFRLRKDNELEQCLLSLEECVDFVKQGRFHLVKIYFNEDDLDSDYVKHNEFCSSVKIKKEKKEYHTSSYHETGDSDHRVGIVENVWHTENYVVFENCPFIIDNVPFFYYPMEEEVGEDEMFSIIGDELSKNRYYYCHRYLYQAGGMYGYSYWKEQWKARGISVWGKGTFLVPCMYALCDTRMNKLLFNFCWTDTEVGDGTGGTGFPRKGICDKQTLISGGYWEYYDAHTWCYGIKTVEDKVLVREFKYLEDWPNECDYW